jgi:hypothetical protein
MMRPRAMAKSPDAPGTPPRSPLAIGHIRPEDRMNRNHRKGRAGDRVNTAWPRARWYG